MNRLLMAPLLTDVAATKGCAAERATTTGEPIR